MLSRSFAVTSKENVFGKVRVGKRARNVSRSRDEGSLAGQIGRSHELAPALEVARLIRGKLVAQHQGTSVPSRARWPSSNPKSAVALS